MGLVFVPVYIKFLGVEAYGLIGVFATLYACFALLDVGLAPTLSREMARYTCGAHSPQGIRDLLRTLEFIYGVLTVMIALLVWAIAPWLAGTWLQAGQLPRSTVTGALTIMGGVISLRLWEGLYKGALQGMQRMVWLNAASALLATFRWAGAAAVVAWISPRIEAFFIWQGGVSLLGTVVFVRETYGTLPSVEHNSRFTSHALSGIWRFSVGLLAITVLGLLLSQMDKIILSHALSLETYGFYMVAATAASVLFQLIYPITNAVYPRLTELATRGDQAGLAEIYHRGCQLMSVIIIPPTLTTALFAEPLLSIWTRNSSVAEKTAPIVVPLVLGTMCNGFMNLPYMLQLAYGWTGLALRVNFVAVALIIPIILWSTAHYGAVGAAYAWFALNSGYVLFSIRLMHQKLLLTEMRRWYTHDIGMPLCAAALIGGIAWWISPHGLPIVRQLLWIAAVGAVLIVVTAMSSSEVRNEISRRLISRAKELSQ